MEATAWVVTVAMEATAWGATAAWVVMEDSASLAVMVVVMEDSAAMVELAGLVASALGAFHSALVLASKSSDKLLTLSPPKPLMPSPRRPLMPSRPSLLKLPTLSLPSLLSPPTLRQLSPPTLNLPSPPTLRQLCQLTANRLPSTLRLCPHIMSLASQCRDRHTPNLLRHSTPNLLRPSTPSQPRSSTLSQHTPRLPSQPTLGQLRQQRLLPNPHTQVKRLRLLPPIKTYQKCDI